MTTLLLIAAAQASTAVVLAPVDQAPDPDKLAGWLQRALARPDLVLVDSAGLVEPDALRDLLLAHPRECGPWLPEEQLADLFMLRDTTDELFVVVPTTRKAKTAVTWRYDVDRSELLRVHTAKSEVVGWAPDHPHVLALTEVADRPVFLARATPLPQAELLDAPTLLTALTAQPSACNPALELPLLDALLALAEPLDGPLYLLAQGPEEAQVWRVDLDGARLARVDPD